MTPKEKVTNYIIAAKSHIKTTFSQQFDDITLSFTSEGYQVYHRATELPVVIGATELDEVLKLRANRIINDL